MFPIIDIRGEVIGFGGRVMETPPPIPQFPGHPGVQKEPQPLRSQFSPKPRAGGSSSSEGYMDVIALHQAGFTNAVAALGTSFTADHARLLARYADEAVLVFDADSAGVQAANRAIPMLERQG